MNLDKPLNVAFFSNHADIIGGGEISFIDLVDIIRHYQINPVVFVPGNGEVFTRLEARHLPPHLYPLPPIRMKNIFSLSRAFFTIVTLLLRHRIHLVHTNGARCMLLVGLAAAICRIPVVWHVRVIERDDHIDRIRSFLAKIIITNSAAVAESLRPFNRNHSKMHIVHNGIDVDKYSSAPPTPLQKEFNLPDLPVVLAVGRLCNWKRFHVLIDSCSILVKRGLQFTCLIIGQDAEAEPEYCTTLRAMPSAANLDNVVFGNWRTDIPSIMKSATLLALPSDHEPFGRVIIEAWACGLPVIATNAGGPAEIITDGVTGLLCPVDDPEQLADQIARTLTDHSLQKRLSTNGLKHVASFTLEAHAKKISSLYYANLNKPA